MPISAGRFPEILQLTFLSAGNGLSSPQVPKRALQFACGRPHWQGGCTKAFGRVAGGLLHVGGRCESSSWRNLELKWGNVFANRAFLQQILDLECKSTPSRVCLFRTKTLEEVDREVLASNHRTLDLLLLRYPDFSDQEPAIARARASRASGGWFGAL